jgi:hypothetical protein
MTQIPKQAEIVSDGQTKLLYTVLPGEVYYTRDSSNPSYAVITIGASNTSEEDIIIAGMQVNLPVSNNVSEANALTSDPSSIVPVSQQPLTWDFQRFDDGIYRAEPVISGMAIPARSSLTFQLQNVMINEAAGTAIITIMENDGDGNFPEMQAQIVKKSSLLNITSFTAVPDHITSGASCKLAWTTQAAARVTLSPGDFPDITPNDSVDVNPLRTALYTLTAFGEGPNISKQITVFINSPEIADFQASASTVDAGDKITLSWNVKYADTISINPGNYNDLPAEGQIENVEIITETSFILTAGNLGNEFSNKTVSVAINPVVINSFTATPGYGARLGEPVLFAWDVSSAVSASVQYGTITGIAKDKLATGTFDITPNTGTAYSLIASNSLGTAMQSLMLFPMPLGWQQFSSSAPFYFPELPMVLNFKTEMWVMASNFMNTVYRSVDGSNWIPAGGAVPWATRSYAAGVVYKDKMWLMGGQGTNGSYLNDVWSSADGVSWNQETAGASWQGRKSFGCFTLPGIDKIFIVAGINSGGTSLTDVWSSPDGKTWTQETAQAFQNGRYAFATVTYNNAVWILAGIVNGSPVNEVWKSTDGISWSSQLRPNWAARSYPVAGALANGIYLGSGIDAQNNGIYDMNRMNASGNWSGQRGFKWKDIRNTSGVEYQDALWFIAGVQPGGENASQNVWAYTPDLTLS